MFKLSKLWHWIRQKAAFIIRQDGALYCYFLIPDWLLIQIIIYQPRIPYLFTHTVHVI